MSLSIVLRFHQQSEDGATEWAFPNDWSSLEYRPLQVWVDGRPQPNAPPQVDVDIKRREETGELLAPIILRLQAGLATSDSLVEIG